MSYLKRPYPGDWAGPPRGPKDPRPLGEDPYLPPPPPPRDPYSYGPPYDAYEDPYRDPYYRRPPVDPHGPPDYPRPSAAPDYPPRPPAGYADYAPVPPPPVPDYGVNPDRERSWGEYPPAYPVQSNPPSSSAQGTDNIDFTRDIDIFFGKGGDQARGRGRGRGGFTRGGRGNNFSQGGRGASNNQQYNSSGNNNNAGSGDSFRGAAKPNRGSPMGNSGGVNVNNRGCGTAPRGGATNRGATRGVANTRGMPRGRGRGAQRGLPPNQFGGNPRGRGRGNNSFVPPVHSLAKARPSFLDVENMSQAEKIHRFCLFLRNSDAQINSIQTVMNAGTSSKLGLKVTYESEELARVAGKPMYTGVVKLDNVFIARAIRPNKKELKQETFEKALGILMSKTVAEIFNMADPGAKAIREELENQLREDKKTEKKEHNPVMQSLIASDISTILSQLVSSIRNMKNVPDNPISIVEQASTQARMVSNHEFTHEVVPLNHNKPFYKGALVFGTTVIGRGMGTTKKVCKLDTYTKALERLRKLPLDELCMSVPELVLPNLTPEDGTANELTMAKPLEERFKDMVTSLCDNSTFIMSYSNQIDMVAMQHGIAPMLIFRNINDESDTTTSHSEQNSDRTLICELYLERILIAECQAPNRRECMPKVYTAAFDVLTQTSPEQILLQHKRITEEEIRDPNLVDVIVKGAGKVIQSNLQGLKRLGHSLDDIEKNKMTEMIIIEHNDWSRDRVRNSFCILQFSCTQNGLLLQWECEQEKSHFKCMMTIQKELVGESRGSNKNHARNLAATDALFKLYETQDVVKITPRPHDKDNWIVWGAIKAEANALSQKNVGEEPIMKSDEHGNSLPDSFILKVLKKKVDKFLKERSSDKDAELIFGPGIGLIETRHIREYAKGYDLRCEILQHQGEPYALFYWKLEWPELLNVLKKKNGPYGKFVLADRSQLPKHKDIEGNILTESTFVKMEEQQLFTKVTKETV